MAQQLAGEGAAISGSWTANVSDNESKAQTKERPPSFTSPLRAQSAQSKRKTLKSVQNLEFTLLCI